MVGVDPRGSLLARPEEMNLLEEGEGDEYRIEGIGYDFVSRLPPLLSSSCFQSHALLPLFRLYQIPGVLSHKYIDHWIKSTDSPSFAAARLLIRTEGLLVGGSSGSALQGALDWLKETEEGRKVAQTVGANVVVLFADS